MPCNQPSYLLVSSSHPGDNYPTSGCILLFSNKITIQIPELAASNPSLHTLYTLSTPYLSSTIRSNQNGLRTHPQPAQPPPRRPTRLIHLHPLVRLRPRPRPKCLPAPGPPSPQQRNPTILFQRPLPPRRCPRRGPPGPLHGGRRIQHSKGPPIRGSRGTPIILVVVCSRHGACR